MLYLGYPFTKQGGPLSRERYNITYRSSWQVARLNFLALVIGMIGLFELQRHIVELHGPYIDLTRIFLLWTHLELLLCKQNTNNFLVRQSGCCINRSSKIRRWPTHVALSRDVCGIGYMQKTAAFALVMQMLLAASHASSIACTPAKKGSANPHGNKRSCPKQQGSLEHGNKSYPPAN